MNQQSSQGPTGNQHRPLQNFQPEVVDIWALDPVERIRFIGNQQAMMHQTQSTDPNSWIKWGIAGVGIVGGIKWLAKRHPEVLQAWLEQLLPPAAAGPAVEHGMVQTLVEEDHVAGFGLQGYPRHVRPVDPEGSCVGVLLKLLENVQVHV